MKQTNARRVSRLVREVVDCGVRRGGVECDRQAIALREGERVEGGLVGETAEESLVGVLNIDLRMEGGVNEAEKDSRWWM